jgi:inorganic pyrophosphatase
MSYGKQPSEFSVRKIGAPNTLEFRAFIEKDGTPVSPFHDVPLYANEQQTVLNMVVEIPRWTNAKLEVHKSTDIGLSSINRTNPWLTRSPKKSS